MSASVVLLLFSGFLYKSNALERLDEVSAFSTGGGGKSSSSSLRKLRNMTQSVNYLQNRQQILDKIQNLQCT